MQWYVSANHAGGYSYRLCKMPERGIKDLTEECFQVHDDDDDVDDDDNDDDDNDDDVDDDDDENLK